MNGAAALNKVFAFQAPQPALLSGALGAASLGGSEGAGGLLLTGTPLGKGEVAMVGEASHGLVHAMAAAFVTLLVEAALAFQKYRFNNGLMLGTTLRRSIGMRKPLAARGPRRHG